MICRKTVKPIRKNTIDKPQTVSGTLMFSLSFSKETLVAVAAEAEMGL